MIGQEAKNRGATLRKVIPCIAIALAIAAVLAVYGCAPQTSSKTDSTSNQTQATEQELASMNLKIADFQDPDSGPLPDAYNIPEKMNAGNRGCDACHEDLQATVKDLCPTVHIMTTGAIFGKTVDWNDCESCHSMHDTRGGVYLANFMHSAHYASSIFTDTDNGNCWSCHATAKDGSMVMYDEYLYDEQMSGYVAYSSASEAFFHMRGYDADSSIGVSTLAADEVDVDVTLDQATTPEDQRYEAVNFDIPEWTQDDFNAWTIEITGVKNPTTFTLADLQNKFTKVTKQVTQSCLVNGVNSSLEDSFEASGYLLSDIIDYCGGVEDGATTVNGIAQEDEGWNFCVELDDSLKNGAFIATEYYGHELTHYQGAPAVLVQPGFPGGTWVKYLSKIEIGTTDVTAPVRVVGGDEFYEGAEDPHLYSLNSAWFNPARDGQTYKVGDTVNLEGYAWAWNVDGHYTGAVRISFDYGHTWITTQVDPNSDPNNWQRFYAKWKPTQAGTYCVKVEAVDGSDGWHQKKPASVFVTITE